MSEEEQVLDQNQDSAADDAVETTGIDTQQEESPEVQATAEPEATETVVEDAPIPEWMKSILPSDDQDIPVPTQKQQEQQTQYDEQFLKDTILDEDSRRAIAAELRSMEERMRREYSATEQKLTAQQRKEAKLAIGNTLQHVHANLYNDQFKNDPDLQGNKELAEFVDSTVQNFVRDAAIEAMQFGDYSRLKQANSPEFGRAVAAMAKAIKGIPEGKPKPVVPKGAVVESGSVAGESKTPSMKFSAADRKAMKEYGLTEQQIIEAAEETNFNISMYDAEQGE